MARRLATATIFFSLLLPIRRAKADDAHEPIAIVYTAPAFCATQQTLLAHVLARTSNARSATAGEAAREFRVHIEQRDGTLNGTLLVPGESNGTPMQHREVTSSNCADLVEALGFFIALAIDARASAPAPRPAPSLAPPPPPPPPAPLPPTPASLAPGAEPRPTPPPTRVMEAAQAVVTRARAQRSSLVLGVGAGGVLATGIAPHAAIGSRLSAHAALEASDASLFAPALSISAVTTTTVTDKTVLGGLALRWSALEGVFCPIAIVSRFAVLRPCALFEWGVLRGDGAGIPNAQRNDAPWLAVGTLGRAELPLGYGLHLDVEAGVAAPLVRQRFDFTSGATAFSTPALGARAALALAARF
ncbi:Type II/IV secretion system ATP hydrolase TadA/VirB11/CpaF, TadA subfamily [Labilithrix luteola]|uniref:Type II/IV secretion system ATP hydrolase TadA/VirB11/CpaF, TadA subfamily n=1 Tax=Labilithrix luteola TaxID=1391654 RepID=A0A0K1QDT2_9BACT|nr:hypothetical protein [Labilithrix luteola]AKV03919.1 Type II/IV secretion system ATP hydrolase TadA/VirB11/CpaF, TadA subfamily [Labilithrix luteola]